MIHLWETMVIIYHVPFNENESMAGIMPFLREKINDLWIQHSYRQWPRAASMDLPQRML